MGETVRPDGEPAPSGSGRVRSGPVRSAVDRVIRDRAGSSTIRAALRVLPAELVVSALLAQRYAAIVDRAAEAEDESRLIAAGEKLRGVLAVLEPKAPEGGGAGDHSSGAGGNVRDLFSGVPTMGNRADA